jgi:hypothetical protein
MSHKMSQGRRKQDIEKGIGGKLNVSYNHPLSPKDQLFKKDVIFNPATIKLPNIIPKTDEIYT